MNKSIVEVNKTVIERVDFIPEETKIFVPQFTASTIIKLGIDNEVKVIRE